MKKKLHLLWCLLLVSALNAQQNWIWMAGTGSSAYLNPVYGIQGVASANNDPGSREFAYLCADNSGNVWLFGGASNAGCRNELWKFDQTTGNWTWMSGGSGTYAACAGIAMNELTSFEVYPNPNNGSFIISAPYSANYSIMNAAGQLIREGQTGTGNTQIDLADYSNGLYFVRIQSNNQTSAIKVIKQ